MITFGQSIPEVKCLVDRIAKYDRLDGLYIGYPAIKSKLPDAEIFQWYGSAALPLCLPFHDKVKKKVF